MRKDLENKYGKNDSLGKQAGHDALVEKMMIKQCSVFSSVRKAMLKIDANKEDAEEKQDEEFHEIDEEKGLEHEEAENYYEESEVESEDDEKNLLCRLFDG